MPSAFKKPRKKTQVQAVLVYFFPIRLYYWKGIFFKYILSSLMILFLDQSIKKVEAVHFTVLCTTLYSNSNSDDSLIWVIEILVFRFWKICGVNYMG